MVPQTFRRQCCECGGEEHGFIIGMGYEQTDAFVSKRGEGGLCYLSSIEACCCD